MNSLFPKVFAYLVLSIITAVPAFAQASQACSVATLNGAYGASIQGFRLLPAPAGTKDSEIPVAGIVRTQFDGRGHLSAFDSVNVGGKLIAHHRLGNGSYTVAPDCTGSFVIYHPGSQPPLHGDLVISDGGSKVREVVTDPNTSIISVGEKI